MLSMQAASKTLRKAGFLACGIGLPVSDVDGDMNGLRIGTRVGEMGHDV